MTLQTEVTTRFSNTLLVQLTNKDDNDATTIDTTVLDAAVADAQAEFLEEVGFAFDLTNASHVRAAVVGVVYYLHTYVFADTEREQRARTRWLSALEKLAVTIGGERRLLPRTDGVLEQAPEAVNNRPDQGRTRWRDYVPRMPGATEADEEILR